MIATRVIIDADAYPGACLQIVRKLECFDQIPA